MYNYLCICFIIVFFVFQSHGQELDYGIMIDAGSTGSRIYLYDWPHRDDDTLPLVQQTINQTIVSMKTNDPLGGYVNNPLAAGASLAPLITYIKQNLDYNKWSSTPIYLKATAGMRALNQSSQALIIQSVRDYLSLTPFLFSSPQEQALVIPGTSEGIFGWITTNYITSVLQQNDPTASFGTLDMGGASTQITFIPAAPPKTNSFLLNLAEIDYNLYTYSYPLGQDASLDILLNVLLQSSNNGVVENPCYLEGYNETYNGVVMVGSANYVDCVSLIEKFIVIKDPSCNQCGIEEVYQPPINGNFYAFSGFAYTYGFLDLQNFSTIADLQAATQIFCETPWATVLAEHNTTAPDYLKFYCFTGAYFQDILTRGYGFSPDSTNLAVQANIGPFDLSWALGAMIYEASLLPFGPSLRSMKL